MIKVIDSIMGSGKTEYCIQMINDNPDKKFIFITPYLKEVERIKKSCKGFEEPEANRKTGDLKINSLNKLIAAGKNIVSTHALFKLTTITTLNQLQQQNYILIIDEALEVVEIEDSKKDDIKTIIDAGLAHVDDDGFLNWDKEPYEGSHENIRRLCKSKGITIVNGTALAWTFPATIFGYFDEVYICTYMFDAQTQRYYFDMGSIQYELFQVVKNGIKYSLKTHDGTDGDKNKININIYTGKKNDIGTRKTGKKDPNFTLSKSWYDKARKEDLKRLKNNTSGYFKNDRKSPADLTLWTTFKEYENDLKGKGYTSGFLSCNARATNNYAQRSNIAYLINVFMNPMVVNFFGNKGIKIDKKQQERYALSSLLQFLFRSALRNGQMVNLYIPSARMRYLLQDWLGQPRTD